MFTLQEQYTNCMRLSYGQRWTPLLEERLKQLGDIIKITLTDVCILLVLPLLLEVLS